MQAPTNAASKITVHPTDKVISVCVGYPVQVGVTVKVFVVIKFLFKVVRLYALSFPISYANSPEVTIQLMSKALYWDKVGGI